MTPKSQLEQPPSTGWEVETEGSFVSKPVKGDTFANCCPFLDLDWEAKEKSIKDAAEEFMPSIDLFKDWMGWMLLRRLDLWTCGELKKGKGR